MADISAKMVKELRDKTGAGMMDCKKALAENDGDIEKSIEWLRKKGMASADKKAGKVAAEGLVDSYIHIGGRIGVLVEVNCQTDFVARNDEFKALVSNITRGMAKELIGFGIRVNAVAPGVIDTPFHERYSTEAQLKANVATIPQGRMGTAEECVGAYLFLASQSLSSYIIGQVIEVNGGQLMP